MVLYIKPLHAKEVGFLKQHLYLKLRVYKLILAVAVTIDIGSGSNNDLVKSKAITKMWQRKYSRRNIKKHNISSVELYSKSILLYWPLESDQ